MCLNGEYTERGIKRRHGYMAEYYSEEPKYLLKIPEKLLEVAVLLEPLTIVEKALEQIKRIQARLIWQPERAMVLGAGPVGLLGGLLLRLEGLEVHFYDASDAPLKPQLAAAMGASFIHAEDRDLGHDLASDIGRLDIVIEATGFSPLAFEAMDMVGPNGIVCLSGVSGGSRKQVISVDHLNLEIVLQNKLVFGTVNANRRHFESGIRHLAEIEGRWPGLLSRLITRRVPIGEFARGLQREPEDVKTIIEITPLPSVAPEIKEVAK